MQEVVPLKTPSRRAKVERAAKEPEEDPVPDVVPKKEPEEKEIKEKEIKKEGKKDKKEELREAKDKKESKEKKEPKPLEPAYRKEDIKEEKVSTYPLLLRMELLLAVHTCTFPVFKIVGYSITRTHGTLIDHNDV